MVECLPIAPLSEQGRRQRQDRAGYRRARAGGAQSQLGPTNTKITIRWSRGVFVPDTAPHWQPGDVRADDDAEKEFLRMLDLAVEKVGLKIHQRNYAPKVFSDDPRCKLKQKRGKAALAAAMDRLLQRRIIKGEPYGPPSNRHEQLIRAPQEVPK
jgi:hypothetical protein